MKLVRVIINQAPNDWRAAAWILERSWPNEYARIERVEQVGEKAESVGVNIYYDTGGKGLAALTDFPYDTDPPDVIAAKQAKLLGHRASDDDQAQPQISDAPPPKVVPKALTGRIRPEWKGNNHGQN